VRAHVCRPPPIAFALNRFVTALGGTLKLVVDFGDE
jgi:hypothetical protein